MKDRDSTETQQSVEEGHRKNEYSIDDVPPWYYCILLGLQHFILMLGGFLSGSHLVSVGMCIQHDYLSVSEILATMFFVSGVVSFLQTSIGIRLPTVQGGSMSFIIPMLVIMNMDQWKCDRNKGASGFNEDVNNTSFSTSSRSLELSDRSAWHVRMREIQGAIILSSLVQVLIGLFGVVGILLRYIGPLTLAPVITLVGLSLVGPASAMSAGNWWIALLTIFLTILFSQYLRGVDIPICTYNRSTKTCHTKLKIPLFRHYAIILAILIVWLLCFILTVTDALPNDQQHWAYAARTDVKAEVLLTAKWFRIPYPGQFGRPTFNIGSAIAMLSGVISGIMESIGDYFACAKACQVPVPPNHALNRGVFIEGLGGVMAGLWGTGAGTTSYSQNNGVITMTKVASRSVVLVCAVMLLVCGIIGKIGALMVSIPTPIVGGVFTILFGVIFAMGISNLQYVDLSSSRNIFVFGFSVLFGLLLSGWMRSHTDVIRTGSPAFDQLITVLLSTSIFVGGVTAFVLDNTVPGTKKERGLLAWGKAATNTTQNITVENHSCYDLPYITPVLTRWKWTKYIPILPTYKRVQTLQQDEENPTNGVTIVVRRNTTSDCDGIVVERDVSCWSAS